MIIRKYSNNLGDKAFTIVEVLIATTIFALVLSSTVVVILGFTHRYYKAVNSSTTQNSSRTIINNVVQAIEFSGATVQPKSSGNVNTYCIGNVQFDYNNIFAGSAPFALIETPDAGTCTTITGTPGASSQELLGSNLQVLKFDITCLSGPTGGPLPCTAPTPKPNVYQVDLIVSYGSVQNSLCDLLQNPHCPQSGQNTGINGTSKPTDGFSCIINTSAPFCDVVELTAVAGTRI